MLSNSEVRDAYYRTYLGRVAMAYSVAWDGTGLVKELSGHVDSEEFARSSVSTTSHPEFDRAKYVLNDFTNVTKADLVDCVEYVALMRIGASRNKSRLKVAYVLHNEDIIQFVSELLSEKYDCGWETKVFETREEAMRWVAN